MNHHFPINCHHFYGVFLWCFVYGVSAPCFFGKPQNLGADSRGFPGHSLEPSNVMWWTQVSLVTCQHATVQRFRLATEPRPEVIGNQWLLWEINGKLIGNQWKSMENHVFSSKSEGYPCKLSPNQFWYWCFHQWWSCKNDDPVKSLGIIRNDF